jgi:hypothetical protein
MASAGGGTRDRQRVREIGIRGGRWWVVSGAAAVGEPLDGAAGEFGGGSKQVRWREEEDEQCMI